MVGGTKLVHQGADCTPKSFQFLLKHNFFPSMFFRWSQLSTCNQMTQLAISPLWECFMATVLV